MAIRYATTGQFKADLKRVRKRGWDTDHLTNVMRQIAKRDTLARKYDAHPLRGKYAGFWECHIEPDFLLVWKVKDSEVVFVRTGNHSELFGEQ